MHSDNKQRIIITQLLIKKKKKHVYMANWRRKQGALFYAIFYVFFGVFVGHDTRMLCWFYSKELSALLLSSPFSILFY